MKVPGFSRMLLGAGNKIIISAMLELEKYLSYIDTKLGSIDRLKEEIGDVYNKGYVSREELIKMFDEGMKTLSSNVVNSMREEFELLNSQHNTLSKEIENLKSKLQKTPIKKPTTGKKKLKSTSKSSGK